MAKSYQTVKGTYDILPDKYRKFDYIDTLWKHFLSLYGYQLIKTPVFEYTGVFQKENDTSDMVTKEMYTFKMNESDSLTLRPEGTAGVIRSFVQNKMHGSNELPVKLAYIEEMFRHERPQKGRQRQFTQLGVECIGEKDPLIDAETIALGYFFVKTLGLESIKVCINTLGDSESRLRYKEALKEYFRPHAECLCHDCQTRLEKNPLRILDCKVDHDQECMHDAPKMADYLTAESKAYFEKVQEYLNVLEIPYEIDSSIVRGLDYYTDTVFEVISTHSESGSQSTIFGGGRYDSLVEQMGGPALSGIGFAIGEERLLILAEAEGIFDNDEQSIDCYVINMLEDAKYALEVSTLLRANGYTTEMNYYKRSMKAQFKSSDRRHARFVAIIGEDEANNRVVNLKDTNTREQHTVKYDELIDFIDGLMGEEDE